MLNSQVGGNSANLSAYSDMSRFMSQSAVCRIAALKAGHSSTEVRPRQQNLHQHVGISRSHDCDSAVLPSGPLGPCRECQSAFEDCTEGHVRRPALLLLAPSPMYRPGGQCRLGQKAHILRIVRRFDWKQHKARSSWWRLGVIYAFKGEILEECFPDLVRAGPHFACRSSKSTAIGIVR
jgi:hypothetical protein